LQTLRAKFDHKNWFESRSLLLSSVSISAIILAQYAEIDSFMDFSLVLSSIFAKKKLYGSQEKN
jgi:hypothetical protein